MKHALKKFTMSNEAKMIRMEKNVIGNTKTVARIEKIMPDSAETSKIANISSSQPPQIKI